jgi:hypothetical protein
MVASSVSDDFGTGFRGIVSAWVVCILFVVFEDSSFGTGGYLGIPDVCRVLAVAGLDVGNPSIGGDTSMSFSAGWVRGNPGYMGAPLINRSSEESDREIILFFTTSVFSEGDGFCNLARFELHELALHLSRKDVSKVWQAMVLTYSVSSRPKT